MPTATTDDEGMEAKTASRPQSILLQLQPADARRMAALCGTTNQHLHQISKRLGITIRHRGTDLRLKGSQGALQQAEQIFQLLYSNTAGGELSANDVHLALLSCNAHNAPPDQQQAQPQAAVLRTPKLHIRSIGEAQSRYMHALTHSEVCFGVGPAGVGKTWLATAAAVQSLKSGQVERIMLVRPAVEAGERLGFLPGDLAQKVEPYQKPLYDALFEFLGKPAAERLLAKGVIEVVPLAYMRGRTLNNAFILLDESQNATVEQMQMLLTRMGNGSRIIVTGDPSQVDLPRDVRSGLSHALRLLSDVPGITVVQLDTDSVARHPLVVRIIEAYAQDQQGGQRAAGKTS